MRASICSVIRREIAFDQELDVDLKRCGNALERVNGRRILLALQFSNVVAITPCELGQLVLGQSRCMTQQS
jgi:hypothetical protein